MSEASAPGAQRCACPPMTDAYWCVIARCGTPAGHDPEDDDYLYSTGERCGCSCHDEDEGDDDPDDNGGRCHWCGGEGWDECDDPIQCTAEHNDDGECRCISCGGSGRAADMTIW